MKQLLLLASISILTGCSSPRTVFFGMEVMEATTDAFSIKTQNSSGKVSFTYQPGVADPNITARGWISEAGKFGVHVRNKGNMPIQSNYFLDRFTMLSKDRKWYDLIKSDISYYNDKVINPGSSAYFSIPSPLGRDNVKLILIELGGSTRLLLQEVPPCQPAQEDLLSSKKTASGKASITKYDGVPFGTKQKDIVKYLNQARGVNRINGMVDFERVPTRPYYRYYINRDYRDADGETIQSEVSLLFKKGKLYQIKDMLGGCYDTKVEAQNFVESISKDLEKKWGPHTDRTDKNVTWRGNGITAELIIEIPTNRYNKPYVKLLIYKGKESLFPVF